MLLERERIVAYALTDVDPDKVVQLKELVYLRSQPQASIDLLGAVWESYPDVKVIRTRLPNDHALRDFLCQLGAEPSVFNPMMWQVVDVVGLLQKLKHVLTRRAANLEQAEQTRTLWQIGDTQLVLAVQRNYVELESAQAPLRYQRVLKFSMAEFVQMLLRGATTLPERIVDQFPYLNTLFPEQPGLLWSSDFF